MASTLSDLVAFVNDYSAKNPGCTKPEVEAAVESYFKLKAKRSVYVGDNFAVRFSAANVGSFSNVVLSLSALLPIDNLPVVICVVSPSEIRMMLANSTFLKKISHSSHALRIDNVKGSFLGHDIMRDYEDIPNSPVNFENLFSIHSQFAWEDNLKRLVEATNKIAPTGVWYAPTEQEKATILQSARLAESASAQADYLAIASKLAADVLGKESDILKAAQINNINQRGNAIEQILTGGVNEHKTHDMQVSLSNGTVAFIDIKSKLMDRSSSPKGYNIDKTLKMLADGKSLFSFFFVGIDGTAGKVKTRLVSILDERILAATRIQFHWAGRNSRGVTQLTGDLSAIFGSDFKERVKVDEAQKYLQSLIDLEPRSA